MATKLERIQKLRDRAAEYRKTAEAKEAVAQKLETEQRKVQADRDRKDETRSKILLGIVLMALEDRLRTPVLRAVPSVLELRDIEFLDRWCKSHKSDLDQSTFGFRLAAAFATANLVQDSGDSKQRDFSSTKPTSNAASTGIEIVQAIVDPVGATLKAILGTLAEGEFGLIAPDILNHASEAQRAVLDPWIASRSRVDGVPLIDELRDQSSGNSTTRGLDEQPTHEDAEAHRSGENKENNKPASGAIVTGEGKDSSVQEGAQTV